MSSARHPTHGHLSSSRGGTLIFPDLAGRCLSFAGNLWVYSLIRGISEHFNLGKAWESIEKSCCVWCFHFVPTASGASEESWVCLTEQLHHLKGSSEQKNKSHFLTIKCYHPFQTYKWAAKRQSSYYVFNQKHISALTHHVQGEEEVLVRAGV